MVLYDPYTSHNGIQIDYCVKIIMYESGFRGIEEYGLEDSEANHSIPKCLKHSNKAMERHVYILVV